jgi:hypothetical protein
MKICEENFEIIFPATLTKQTKTKIARTTIPLKLRAWVLTSPGRVSWLEDVEDREQLLAQGSLPPEAGLIQFFSHQKNRTISKCQY